MFDHHVITIFVDGPTTIVQKSSAEFMYFTLIISSNDSNLVDMFQQIDTLFYRSHWSSHGWTISESCSFKIGAPASPGHWISVFRSAG